MNRIDLLREFVSMSIVISFFASLIWLMLGIGWLCFNLGLQIWGEHGFLR